MPESTCPLTSNTETMEENRKRYSDEELEEFRVLILDKLEKANKEYELLVSEFESSDNGENAHKHNILEDSSSAVQRAEAERLAGRQRQFIQKLQAALTRIDNKTYGICRETGELIPKDRLRAVPHATLSIEAKTGK